MNIAVAASGPDLLSAADPRFGRCAWFVLVDTESLAFEALENAAVQQGSGAGVAAAQQVAGTGAVAVVAANVGPNAHQALTAGGIKVYAFDGGTVGQAVEAFKAGLLPELSRANVPSHTGMGGGGSRGLGLAAVAQAASAADPAALAAQADALEAQVSDLRDQIAKLQAPAGGAG
jgi:predicted Fe-Mo cluster-binding NifX family protein